MAKRFRGEKISSASRALAKGGMQAGAFHEGMNIAAVEQVPLVWLRQIIITLTRRLTIENLRATIWWNGRSDTDSKVTHWTELILQRVLDVIGGAVKRARAGRPPQLVVASVLRLSGHGEHDDASYVPEEMKRQPFARDCLKVAEQTIIESNLLDPNTLAEWRKEAVAQVDEAVATAQKEAVPEADKEDWCALSNRELVDHAEENE
jgi:pyruvate dehydrogenase E1 component alpha subunit/2-oxoisovalerate dehydrogenase E1 component alpha subunit